MRPNATQTIVSVGPLATTVNIKIILSWRDALRARCHRNFATTWPQPATHWAKLARGTGADVFFVGF